MVETSSPTSYPGTSDPTSPGPPDLGCTQNGPLLEWYVKSAWRATRALWGISHVTGIYYLGKGGSLLDTPTQMLAFTSMFRDPLELLRTLCVIVV